MARRLSAQDLESLKAYYTMRERDGRPTRERIQAMTGVARVASASLEVPPGPMEDLRRMVRETAVALKRSRETQPVPSRIPDSLASTPSSVPCGIATTLRRKILLED